MADEGKPLVWLAGEVRTPPFSQAARVEAGFLLRQLQEGAHLGLPHARPMPSLGKQCHELRVQDENETWRIMLRIDDDAVVILDVFSKKTARTPARIIEACRNRLKRYDAAARGQR